MSQHLSTLLLLAQATVPTCRTPVVSHSGAAPLLLLYSLQCGLASLRVTTAAAAQQAEQQCR
jgi:hypothetical protein